MLKQQLGDANHHLDLEKTISQTLLEKLEESKATSKNFESLFAQHEEVVRRLDEQKTQIDTQCHRGTEESNSKYVLATDGPTPTVILIGADLVDLMQSPNVWSRSRTRYQHSQIHFPTWRISSANP